MHETAARIYRENLLGARGEGSRAYLESRGIRSETEEEFGVGLSDPNGRQLAKALASYGPELMEASGLFVRDRHGELRDRFRGRLMFPIRDAAGNTVAFGGRKLEENGYGPKYLNSKTSPIYSKGAMLYNLHRAREAARESGELLTVEGYLDVMAAHQAGVHNVVAVSGTALTEEQARLVKASAHTAVLNLDSDAAGQQAIAKHARRLLEEGVRVRVAELPTAKDPAQYIQESGPELFRHHIRESDGVVAWLNSNALGKHGDEKADTLHEAIEILSASAPELRPELRKELAGYFGVPEPAEAIAEQPKTVHERRAWDLTISAPKSVSAAALVAGDERVLVACRESLKIALDAAEEYTQAHLGGNRGVKTTGNWAAAVFEHDSARPTKGRAPAPQAHWHVVMFNLTDAGDKIRSLEPRELFRVQSYVTAIFRAELAVRLKDLGYEIRRTTEPLFRLPGLRRGESFEIAGFSDEYLRAISPRTTDIQAEMERRGVAGPTAKGHVVHATRLPKQEWPPEALQAEHRKLAELYGNEPDKVCSEALQKAVIKLQPKETAAEAVEFARTKLAERSEVFDRYETIRDALRKGLGTLTLADVRQALDARVSAENGAFIRTHHYRQHAPGERYTTPETIQRNEEILEWLKAGRDRLPAVASDVSFENHPEFRDNAMRAVVLERILASRDQAIALQGAAGSKKSTSLMLLKPLIERAGYTVKALAPTGAAVQELKARGIDAETLEGFLCRTPKAMPIKTYYFLDETSLASTRQIHNLIQRVQPHDRVLFVGDDSPKRKVGQHKSVEGGRIFYQMQQAGIQTAYLNRMYRQQTLELQEVARLLKNGHIEQAIDKLAARGNVKEIEKPKERFVAIAKDFVKSPAGTFACVADNTNEGKLNQAIRTAMREVGRLHEDAFAGTMLVGRSLTKAETKEAWCYQRGDIVRFAWAVKGPVSFRAAETVRVEEIDDQTNRLRVRRKDGTECWFDPRTARAVSVYATEVRSFAVGERVQFTNAIRDNRLRVSNRDTGTIISLDAAGNARIRLDTQRHRSVGINLRQMCHVDHAYALTSYSLQGKTTKRLLFEAGTKNTQWHLLGKDFAYVGGTRPEFELVLYTDSVEDAKRALSQEHIKPQALPRERIEAYRRQEAKRELAVGA